MRCSANCASCITLTLHLLLVGCATAPVAQTPLAAAPAPATAPAATPQAPDPQLEAVRADYAIALAAITAGDLATAATLLRDIATRAPTAATPLANLARVQQRLGQFDEAEKSLQEAIARRPDAAFYNALGVLQRTQGRFAEARHSYEQALASDDGYAAAHHNLAVLCDLYLDEPATALEHYRRYQQLTGNSEQSPVAGWIANLDRRLKERP